MSQLKHGLAQYLNSKNFLLQLILLLYQQLNIKLSKEILFFTAFLKIQKLEMDSLTHSNFIWKYDMYCSSITYLLLYYIL